MKKKKSCLDIWHHPSLLLYDSESKSALYWRTRLTVPRDLTMESHLLVGPISAARYGCAANSSHFHSAASSTWANSPRRRSPLVMASSSSAAVNGGQNYYAVLGVARTATTVQIKRAYRLLARKVFLDFLRTRVWCFVLSLRRNMLLAVMIPDLIWKPKNLEMWIYLDFGCLFSLALQYFVIVTNYLTISGIIFVVHGGLDV